MPSRTEIGRGDDVAALCGIHTRLAKSNPRAEPPTLFEFLHLDAYAFTVPPPDVSLHSTERLHTESEGYDAAKEAILTQAIRMSPSPYEEPIAAGNKWVEVLTIIEAGTGLGIIPPSRRDRSDMESLPHSNPRPQQDVA